MGRGKTMVEFFSLEMVARVWRYLVRGRRGELWEVEMGGLEGRRCYSTVLSKGCK